MYVCFTMSPCAGLTTLPPKISKLVDLTDLSLVDNRLTEYVLVSYTLDPEPRTRKNSNTKKSQPRKPNEISNPKPETRVQVAAGDRDAHEPHIAVCGVQ